MGNDYIQLKADEDYDGYVYLFNPEKNITKKVCYIVDINECSPSIIRQIRLLKKNAAWLPDV